MKYGLHQSEQGHTLIELMISLAIGIVICFAIAGLYSQTSGAKRSFDQVAVLRDSARTVLQIMGDQIRVAGYGLFDTTSGKSMFLGGARTGRGPADAYGFPVFGCENGFAADPPTNVCAAAGAPAFSVAYQAAASDSLRDCEGNTGSALTAADVPAGVTLPAGSRLIQSSFRLSGAELQCRGSGGAWQTLVDKVQSFSVNYGIDTNKDGAGEPNQEARSADTWNAAGPVAPHNWADVVAVRLCLVLRSEDNAGVSNMSYADCSGAVQTGTNNRIYQRAELTVQIRNIRAATGAP